MALVGDVLVYVREMGPDPSPALIAPVTFTATGSTASGTLPAGTYNVVFTAFSPWGESLPTATTVVTIASSGNIALTCSLPVGATGWRAYIQKTTDAGTNGYILSSDGSNQTISAPLTATLQVGTVPTRATGMNPDSDGAFVSAWTLYRWLNDALRDAGRVSGGMLDKTGVRAVQGTALYRVTQGQWIKFTNIWYDGYPVNFENRDAAFANNVVTGLSGIMSMEQVNENTVFQMWPQPSRSGNSTTLSGGITASATSLVVGAIGSMLPLGLLQIDNEILGYAGLAGTTVNGVMRGLGGTIPAAHSNGAALTELNIMLSGWRLPTYYSVGNSTATLSVPGGWEPALKDYILGRYKMAEQDVQGGQQLIQNALQMIDAQAKKFRAMTGPRQIGNPGQREVFPLGPFGGIIIP